MGKKVLKNFFVIVLFPLTIIFLIFKRLYNNIYNNYINTYISSLDIGSIDSLSGVEFEELIFHVFRNIGFKVSRTSKSHDYGADLILEINRIKIVLQCKMYYGHNVGISAVQEVYSSLKYYGASLGVVITNSYFTRSAINLSETTNVLLWDRENLIKLLKLKEHEKIDFRRKLTHKILNEGI